MKNITVIFLTALILAGCSPKYEPSYTHIAKTTEQAVANTKKAQILKEKKPVIFATVTYLDSLENKKFVDKNLEQFVVGIHFTHSKISREEQEKMLKKLTFQIDDNKTSVTVIALKSTNPILNIIPASTPWSHYFLVQTPKIQKNTIVFSFQIPPYQRQSLTFKKDF
ncbi:hypothetical protein [Sulfurospirillum sp. 1612]|uniref:hypothetical protein n=1 Tax=Sulfurospirillum sp. 1612 TaxID=3094835 RepID=UPI002F945694